MYKHKEKEPGTRIASRLSLIARNDALELEQFIELLAKPNQIH